MSVRIEATLGEMPSILVKLLHHGFTFKVIPQFKADEPFPDGTSANSITDITIIEIEETEQEHVESSLDDQVPDWAKFIKDRKPEFVIS